MHKWSFLCTLSGDTNPSRETINVKGLNLINHKLNPINHELNPINHKPRHENNNNSPVQSNPAIYVTEGRLRILFRIKLRRSFP